MTAGSMTAVQLFEGLGNIYGFDVRDDGKGRGSRAHSRISLDIKPREGEEFDMAGNMTLDGLNEHLFAQLERLNEAHIPAEKLKTEIERSRAVCSVAATIVNNARLALDAEKIRSGKEGITKLPRMIGSGNGEKA
jgi:hypothetical protein